MMLPISGLAAGSLQFLKCRATTVSCACVDFGNWFFLLKIFLKFWYDAEKLGHESESCGFKDALESVEKPLL
jgi:hypothetical protein